MKIYLRARQESTAYANVRMSAVEYQRIRKRFRADEELLDSDVVHIARGTYLVKQGYGWYRIVNYSGLNWLDRILFAIRKLTEWEKRFNEDRNQLLRQLMGYGGPAPATPESLQRLVRKFSENRI